MFALGGEELGPGHYFGVLLEQCPPLPLGHAAPHAELDPVVQRICAALSDNRTVPANHCRLALRGPANEEFVGVSGPTSGLRHPRDARFGSYAVHRSYC